ncbi:MAG: hypothetical protein NDF51_05870 [archaeon YNP-WB-040]|nr:hypothetical protein [Candidatus Culexarchaeum yellowstonense]
MLMDLLGVGGIVVLGYLTYEVCRVDRRMCRLGVLGLVFVVLAFVGRYVVVDRSIAVFVVLLAVVLVLLLISR